MTVCAGCRTGASYGCCPLPGRLRNCPNRNTPCRMARTCVTTWPGPDAESGSSLLPAVALVFDLLFRNQLPQHRDELVRWAYVDGVPLHVDGKHVPRTSADPVNLVAERVGCALVMFFGKAFHQMDVIQGVAADFHHDQHVPTRHRDEVAVLAPLGQEVFQQ